MFLFYKKNIQRITEAAVNPDRRRYAVPEEAPRHFIDLNHWPDTLISKKLRWNDAVAALGEDSISHHGIVVWHIPRMVFRLQDAFLMHDPSRIITFSAELGHYVADANVPLHTTSNYNGQQTDQHGIHAFWESRLPELFSSDYDFFAGKASYIPNVQLAVWEAVIQAHHAVDSVLLLERKLYTSIGDGKFNFETKGKQTVKVVSAQYARHYHRLLAGMVERQMRSSIRLTGDLWYTAWVNAGQPDLAPLINYIPDEEEFAARKAELLKWKQVNFHPREHERDTLGD